MNEKTFLKYVLRKWLFLFRRLSQMRNIVSKSTFLLVSLHFFFLSVSLPLFFFLIERIVRIAQQNFFESSKYCTIYIIRFFWLRCSRFWFNVTTNVIYWIIIDTPFRWYMRNLKIVKNSITISQNRWFKRPNFFLPFLFH